MRTYETLYVIQPEATEDEVQSVTAGVDTLISEDGGEVLKSDVWGKRRLAYDVKGFREGIFVLTRFNGSTSFPRKLEGHFKLNEQVIRYLVVHFDVKTLRLEAEQVRRNEAALESRNATGPRSRASDADVRAPAASETRAAVEA